MLNQFFGYILTSLVQFYKKFVSPLTPASCRYEPSCSSYMLQAVKVHGAAKGFWLGLKRISRCHPWGGCGYDPVPGKSNDKTS